MRQILLILLTFLSINLWGKTPAMVEINNRKGNLSRGIITSIRSGIEDQLTGGGYSIVSDTARLSALKEQAKQRKKGCYDDGCLVATGRMLAARELIVVEITPVGGDYLFKLKLIDLETAETRGSSTDFYKRITLKSGSKTYFFARRLMEMAIKGERIKEEKRAVMGSVLPPKSSEKIQEGYQQRIKVVFYSRPAGARVSVDGSFIGKTPTQIEIPRGDHIFKYELENYVTVIRSEELYIDSERTVDLERMRYRVKFNYPGGATVDTDQKICDIQNHNTRTVRALPGTICRYKFTKKGFYPQTLIVTFDRNQEITVKMAKIPRETVVFTGLDGVAVGIDDFDCGIKNNRVTHLRGTICTYHFKKAGYYRQKMNVEIRNGKTVAVKLNKIPLYTVRFKNGEGVTIESENPLCKPVNNRVQLEKGTACSWRLNRRYYRHQVINRGVYQNMVIDLNHEMTPLHRVAVQFRADRAVEITCFDQYGKKFNLSRKGERLTIGDYRCEYDGGRYVVAAGTVTAFSLKEGEEKRVIPIYTTLDERHLYFGMSGGVGFGKVYENSTGGFQSPLGRYFAGLEYVNLVSLYLEGFLANGAMDHPFSGGIQGGFLIDFRNSKEIRMGLKGGVGFHFIKDLGKFVYLSGGFVGAYRISGKLWGTLTLQGEGGFEVGDQKMLQFTTTAGLEFRF